MSLWEEMKKKGISPNLGVLNSVLDVYCRENNMEMVSKALKTMKELNIEPDTYTYNLLITSINKAFLTLCVYIISVWKACKLGASRSSF